VKCGHEFERMEAMSEKPLTQCSQIITSENAEDTEFCGGELKKLVYSVPGRVQGGTPRFHR
jgi:predicted nucleic acid-binding Zn ribbon protein